MKKIFTTAAFLLPVVLLAQKETEVTARITDVTVYMSSAEINYEKDVLLHRGQNVLVFTDLTPFIVENSINVSAGEPAVNIITVSERINYAKQKKDINAQVFALQDSIYKMNKELGLIKCRRETAETEKTLLFRNEAIGGLSTQGVAVAEIEKASAFFSKRYYELSKELYTQGEREQELRDRIKKYESQLKELSTVSVQTTSEIRVTVNSPSEMHSLFKFRFLTAKAGWAPVYDFKFEGANKPLQFVFRANVFNASGVAWQDVSIRLSTADPIVGFSVPSLQNNENTPREKAPVQGVKFKQIEIVNAITDYTIAHQYTIPSDAKPYLVDVSTDVMPAGFNYLLIPKLDPFGFLMAKIPDWNKYNLIPGVANIYNMGSYMGKTFLDTYADNDTLSLYLGKDKNIQAVRSEKNNTKNHFLAGNYFVENTKTEIIIKNNAKESIPIEMLDQVPVFEKEDKEKMTLSNVGNALYNKQEGLLRWTFSLQSGESKTISYSYEIKTPKEYYDSYHTEKRKYRTISCPAF
ncbi:MAG: DUF4139 domain-containing protein [Bacteroidetes bacterium]|nr:DUF4139 domain-containing protein [Bacteroidota bacterium]